MNGKELKEKIIAKQEYISEQKAELYKMMDEYGEKYEAQELKAEYMNKYFVYNNNCYSCPEKPEDYWNVYYKVISINGKQIECIAFSKDSNNSICFENETRFESAMSNLKEITQEEYFKHFDLLMNDVRNFRT